MRTGGRALLGGLAVASALVGLLLCFATTPAHYVYYRVQLHLDERTVQPRPAPPSDLPSDPFLTPSPEPT